MDFFSIPTSASHRPLDLYEDPHVSVVRMFRSNAQAWASADESSLARSG